MPSRILSGGLLLALFLAVGWPTWGEAAPRIEFDHRSHDFGEVLQGKNVQHRFPFRNAGDEPLVIKDVSTPCGCTVALPEKMTLAPGEASQIDVTYDSSARSGDVERVVTVVSNDPQEPELKLLLHARVDASMHMGFTSGETLFGPKCGSCHAVPAEGLKGAALYDAVCWFCHGKAREGKTAPSLPQFPDTATDYLRGIIETGRENTEMPGFSKARGGPLDDGQIASLIELLHREPPPPPTPAAEPAKENPNATDQPFFE